MNDLPNIIDVLKCAIEQAKQTHPMTECYIGISDAKKVFDHLTSTPKWYHTIGIDRHHASKILKKHREGKYTNYEWFFANFGYKTIHVMWPIQDKMK